VFQVEQGQNYSFQLMANDLPAGVQLSLTDSDGQPIGLETSFDGNLYAVYLNPGTYTISVGGWAPGAGAALSYELLMTMGTSQDNAPPLVDGPAPALQVAFVTDSSQGGGFSWGGPLMPVGTGGGGSIVGSPAGPVEGETGSGLAIGEGTGPGSSTGGSAPAVPSGPATAGFSQAQAAAGLAGLGMGPLGGSGGQAGTIEALSIQVALNAPASASPSASSVAVALVTMTQMFPWGGEGEPINLEEIPETAVVESGEPAAAPHETAAVAAAVPPAIPREEAPEIVLASAAMPGLLPGPTIRFDRPEPTGPAEPAPAPTAPGCPPASPMAPASEEASGPGSGNGAVRLVIAAATLAAIYRGRHAIRGLGWRRGTTADAAGHARATGFEAATSSRSPHVRLARSRGLVRAATPRP
jgi:hypothetical protein